MSKIEVLDGMAASEWDQVAASELDDAYQDEHVRGAFLGESLGKVPRRPTLLVEVSTSVAETIAAMNQQHVGCALVVRGGKLAGIFTERDVLRKIAGAPLDLSKTRVELVMTADPETLPETASVAYALRKMNEEGYRHIPLVTPDGRPVAVVAVRDIVAWMCELFPKSVHNLPPEPGYPKTVDGG